MLMDSLGSDGLVIVVLSGLDDGLLPGVPSESVCSSSPTMNCTMVRSGSCSTSTGRFCVGARPPSFPSSPVRRSTLSRRRLGLPAPLLWDPESFSFLFWGRQQRRQHIEDQAVGSIGQLKLLDIKKEVRALRSHTGRSFQSRVVLRASRTCCQVLKWIHRRDEDMKTGNPSNITMCTSVL